MPLEAELVKEGRAEVQLRRMSARVLRKIPKILVLRAGEE